MTRIDSEAPSLETPVALVATDLDGTFLNAQGHISALNEAAFRRAADHGVHLVVATGRPWRWLDVLTPLHDLDLHVLASNGAVRYDLRDGVVTSHDALDVAVMREVIADLSAHDSTLAYALEHVDGWSCDEQYAVLADGIQPDPWIGDIDQAVEREPVVKMLVRSDTLPTDVLAAALEPVIGERLTPTWSYVQAKGMIEISSPGITKASGLMTLLRDLHVDASEAVAFGDMPNDIAMLELVGRPYAMANAHESLLSRGFPVAGHHDDSAVGRVVDSLLG